MAACPSTAHAVDSLPLPPRRVYACRNVNFSALNHPVGLSLAHSPGRTGVYPWPVAQKHDTPPGKPEKAPGRVNLGVNVRTGAALRKFAALRSVRAKRGGEFSRGSLKDNIDPANPHPVKQLFAGIGRGRLAYQSLLAYSRQYPVRIV